MAERRSATLGFARGSRQQVFVLLVCFVAAGNCADESACSLALSFNGTQKRFTTFRNLGVQKASIAWSLFTLNHTLEVGFVGRATSPSGWVGWGINFGPNPIMDGASTLIAFRSENGSNLLPFKLTDQTYRGVLPSCSPVDLVVLEKAVEISGTDVKIFASLRLRPNQTELSHIWNRGPGTDQFRPQAHDLSEVKGALRINMLQGTILSVAPPHQHLKYIHGIINTLSWGFILPLGAIIARYFRRFEADAGTSTWFYAHIMLQSSGYILGITGWAIGMQLGSYSKGVMYPQHRIIGIAIFTFASMQVLSLLQRPDKSHKLRMYWNIYHHTLGYSIVLLAIVNNFQGFYILRVSEVWRIAYIMALGVGASMCIILEILTWSIYLKSRSIYPPKILDRKYGGTHRVELGKLGNIMSDEFDKSRAFSWSIY